MVRIASFNVESPSSRPQAFRNASCSIGRPVIEALIWLWAPAAAAAGLIALRFNRSDVGHSPFQLAGTGKGVESVISEHFDVFARDGFAAVRANIYWNFLLVLCYVVAGTGPLLLLERRWYIVGRTQHTTRMLPGR
jgi:hypothetical protein